MIAVVEPPARKKSGRSPRLSPAEVQQIAEAIAAGQFANDGTPAPSQSAAYQRGQAIAKTLAGDPYKLADTQVRYWPVDENGTKKDPHNWAVGPAATPATPTRSRRRNKETSTEAPAPAES